MTNPFTIALIAIAILALLLFLILRNKKDRKELENTLNEDRGRPERHRENEDLPK